MPKTIAVLGAGPGLGAATARRFGREGFDVALVGRRPEPLGALVEILDQEGIRAAAFPADLAEPAGVPALVDAITGRLGPIDVVEYAPIGSAPPFAPAAGLAAATLRGLMDLHLYTPVEVARAVVPGMVARGDGAFLLAQGVSALAGAPGMSGVGPVMAAARNWIQSLHAELADQGVYAGTLTIGAWIEGSAAHRAAAEHGRGGPVVAPEDLADHYWDLYTKRDRSEQVVPERG
ncbi:SDR family NAD(P)-dependent oxidoreductase [Actinomadura rayongensis]|uniref:SDR family NAD(P)-dependent oxidoreductase n=1 Tax=Actinomadura rayongensis TaxID=1429076 RepID=A0A6I4WAH5_9ACTN|nr:SDR family NAD(P)-dependent oxidoreductase [Actinomadura rayongensis]MXQ65285.1 SDR family NAD(P)-dependent oxidoreductase [Actinomadura rayongensis]